MNEATVGLDGSLRPADGVVARPVGGEMVALNLETGLYYSLNELGAMIWTDLAAGSDRAAIVDRIVREYEVTAETAAQDLDQFLRQLIEWRLVQSA